MSMFIGLLTAAAASAAPQPSGLSVYKDWVVGCDNGGVCEAISLVPENGGARYDGWDGPLSVTRDPSLDDVLKVSVYIDAVGADRYSMLVDGKLVDTGPIAKGDTPIEIVGEDAKKVASAIARGMQLDIKGPSGEHLTRISLAGSAAALRKMDTAQRRAGTPTALVAKGRRAFRPVETVIPIVPVLRSKPSTRIPETSDIVALAESSDCAEDRVGVVQDEAFPIGEQNGKMRALVLISCGSGAYNFSSVAYIGTYDAAGRGAKGWSFELANFDFVPGWSKNGNGRMLVNASWMGGDDLLSSYSKGRGLGDCGSSETYVWDGAIFRLTEATSMNECRGAYKWITTWRAAPVVKENVASAK